MANLSSTQVEHFNQDGFLFLPNVIPTDKLHKMQNEFEQWKEESRGFSEPYGKTFDNRPRFDIEPGHSADKPALRRIASPIEISETYLDFMRNNRALDDLVDILGPDLKFENAKINSKQPGAATQIKYHQDFLFEPHTNDDMVTVLFFIDDVTEENGPLEVVPGTHKGPLFEHWHDGVFTGAVSAAVASEMKAQAVPCHGPAGSACLMHTRVLHGSAPNLANKPRTLFICEYTAEDAYPLQANHIPSVYMYELVRGKSTGRVRCSEYEMISPKCRKVLHSLSSKPGKIEFDTIYGSPSRAFGRNLYKFSRVRFRGKIKPTVKQAVQIYGAPGRMVVGTGNSGSNSLLSVAADV